MNRAQLKNFPMLGYAANEAMNTLFTNLTFSGPDIKKIILTSCHPTDGKTFVSMNLARTMALMGQKVALVDLDLRKSVITHDFLTLGEGDGLGSSHYLAGLATLDEVVYATNVRNLFIVPCTKSAGSSLTLLNSPNLKKMLDALAEQMDYVVVDSPPVGMLIDTAQVARNCDGTLLVAAYNATNYREFIEAKNQLEQSGCPILGAVINKADFTDYVGKKYGKGRYYDAYGYYYAPSDDAASDKKEDADKHSRWQQRKARHSR